MKTGDWKPLIVAHRGAQDEEPENTYPAFERAIAHGADGIEFDVQMTRDGVPVLHHDRTLLRHTGSRRRIADVSYYELKTMARRGLYSTRLKGETLLSLDEALKQLLGRTRLFVEIKSREIDRRQGRSMILAEKVMKALAQRVPEKLEQTVFVLSFDREIIRMFAEENGSRWPLVLNHAHPPRRAGLPEFPAIRGHGVKIGKLDAASAETIHEGNALLLSWACNGPRQLTKARRLGIDILLTDRPGWLCNLRRNGRLQG